LCFDDNAEEAAKCGWLTDKFGVSWQIVPTAFGDVIHHKDGE
jgi:predicted 3-demethylubiquinone-9 3-methyltransferase (glyoxalase superfamily)